MFKIAVSPSYSAPVTVMLPGIKAGNVFDAEFRRFTQDEVQELSRRVRGKEIDDKQFCREVLAGWKGVHDAEGEVGFSATALEDLLNIYPVPSSIVQAFYTSLEGSREKN